MQQARKKLSQKLRRVLSLQWRVPGFTAGEAEGMSTLARHRLCLGEGEPERVLTARSRTPRDATVVLNKSLGNEIMVLVEGLLVLQKFAKKEPPSAKDRRHRRSRRGVYSRDGVFIDPNVTAVFHTGDVLYKDTSP